MAVSLLRRLLNVVTGRYGYYNTNNLDYVHDFYNRISIERKEDAPLMRELLQTSMHLVNYCLGPDGYNVLNIDCKKVSKDQYIQLHRINMYAFAALLCRKHPGLGDRPINTLNSILGSTPREQGIASKILSMPPDDFTSVLHLLWQETLQLIPQAKLDSLDRLGKVTVYAVFFTNVCKDFFEAVSGVIQPTSPRKLANPETAS